MRNGLIAVALALTALPAAAQDVRSAPRGQWCEDSATPARKSTCDVLAHRNEALLNLRQRMVAAEAAEGGTMSKSTRARYQVELDAINARYRRQIRNATVYSVDSTGRSTIG